MHIQFDFAPQTQEDRAFLADAEWILAAESVKRLDGSEFPKSQIDLVTQVSDYFKSIGGKVERENFGTVILNHRGAKDSIAHGIGRVKAAAFKAVPDVIKFGRIIDHQKNWKGRGYDTYVIDAPITIGGIDYVAEVIVEQSKEGKNTFYLHEVETKKMAQDVFKTATKRGTPRAEKDVFKTATKRGTPKYSRMVMIQKLSKLSEKTNYPYHKDTSFDPKGQYLTQKK